MVRLLQELLRPQDDAKRGFNPTMVRLLRGMGFRCERMRMEFQSHNGAIAAYFSTNFPIYKERFNPTMVRLLP